MQYAGAVRRQRGNRPRGADGESVAQRQPPLSHHLRPSGLRRRGIHILIDETVLRGRRDGLRRPRGIFGLRRKGGNDDGKRKNVGGTTL